MDVAHLADVAHLTGVARLTDVAQLTQVTSLMGHPDIYGLYFLCYSCAEVEFTY